MSDSFVQESSLNENPIFQDYDSFLFEDIHPNLPYPNDNITDKPNEQKNKANNSQDEKFDNIINFPDENSLNVKKEINPEQIKSSDVIFLTKKTKTLGRKPKNSTEKGEHTSASEDNKYDKDWRSFFNHLIKSLNNYIRLVYKGKVSPTLENTNVKKQFGSSNVRREQFIKTKTYKVLIYNPPPNNKYKKHRNFGSNNEKIIRQLVIEKKDELITALMKLDIESIHNIFIGNEKKINIKGKEYDLSNFKILNDYITEKINELKKYNLSDEEIDKDIFMFEGKFKNVISYIKEEGKNKSRKKELDEKDIITYGTIDELEEKNS